MTQFVIDELKKTLAKLKETDPSSPSYHATLQSLEYINGMADTIETAVAIVDGMKSSFYEEGRVMEAPEECRAPVIKEFSAATAEVAEEKEQVNPAPETAPVATKKYTKADLRKALLSAKEEGADIAELLGRYGAKNVNDVKEADYAEIIGLYGES